jgi:hypothetical protein
MGYAQDMGRLRHEVEELRSGRIRFVSDLRQDMQQARATMRHNVFATL